MGQLTHLFYPWGLILQAFAILHFIRRRPDTYWLYINPVPRADRRAHLPAG